MVSLFRTHFLAEFYLLSWIKINVYCVFISGTLAQSHLPSKSKFTLILASGFSFSKDGRLQNLSLDISIATTLQIWRPIGNGKYKKLWSAPRIGLAEHETVENSIIPGLAVKKGDVIGWRVDRGHLGTFLDSYDGSVRSENCETVFHVEEEVGAMTEIVSVCGKTSARKLKRSFVIKYSKLKYCTQTCVWDKVKVSFIQGYKEVCLDYRM